MGRGGPDGVVVSGLVMVWLLEGFIYDVVDFVTENIGGELFGGFLDDFGVEIGRVEGFKGFCEGFRGLFGEKETVFLGAFWVNKVAAAAFRVGDDGAASGEGLDSGDAEGLKAGKKVGLRGLEIGGELGGFEPRDEGDEGGGISEFDEVFVLGAVADNEERFLSFEAGFDSEVDAFPGDLAARDDKRRFRGRGWSSRFLREGGIGGGL